MSDFDPMKKNYWSLPMAVAWIVWRQEEQVRDHWAEFQRSKHRLGGDNFHEETEDQIDNLGVMTLMDMLNAEARCDPDTATQTDRDNEAGKLCTVKKALDGLWHKLERGELHASGIKDSERKDIASALWQDFADLDDFQRDYLISKRSKYVNNMKDEWTDVSVNRDELMKLWPANSSDGQEAESKVAANISTHSNQPKIETAKLAILSLWPQGVPATLMASSRDAQIKKWCKENGKLPPSERTIRKVLQPK